MPICRKLSDGVQEVRSTIKNGKVEARTYFSIENSLMLLLHEEEGKDGQKVAIDRAVARLLDHSSRTRKASEKR